MRFFVKKEIQDDDDDVGLGGLIFMYIKNTAAGVKGLLFLIFTNITTY